LFLKGVLAASVPTKQKRLKGGGFMGSDGIRGG
jgi:hypothetical protein